MLYSLYWAVEVCEPCRHKLYHTHTKDVKDFFSLFQERKEAGKRGRKPGRKAAADKVDMKAKLGKQY